MFEGVIMEEMIEKQITVLVSKSALEEFETITKDYTHFTANQYREEFNLNSVVKSKSLTLEIVATKIIR